MEDTAEPIGREMTAFERLCSSTKGALIRARRKYIPYLVWYGQEMDATITFKENRLTASNIAEALEDLNSGHLRKIELMLSEIGIEFDRGLGGGGRDWEWDWSLKGPVSLQFRGPCKTQEKRK